MARRETCSDCGKPLGGTVERCHECGGESRRGGTPVSASEWRILLGV